MTFLLVDNTTTIKILTPPIMKDFSHKKPINSSVRKIYNHMVKYVEISPKTHLKPHSQKSLALDD
jgi:hypothetical protein